MSTYVQFTLLLIVFVQSISALKILIFVPTLSRSNGIFSARIGDLLANHGHDVTLYSPRMDPSCKMDELSKNCTVLSVDAGDEDSVLFNRIHVEMQKLIFDDVSMADSRTIKHIQMATSCMNIACETQVKNKAVLDQLRSEKFDIAFAHMYDLCPFGIIEILQIPATIWMSSTGVIVEQMSTLAGVATPSSFVPGTMSAFSDRMSFKQRFMNMIGANIFTPLFLYKMNSMTEVFRKHIRPDFPDLAKLASDKSQLLFINGIELLDFPRPVLHKVIYMGGIGMQESNALDDTWSSLLDRRRDGAILISFGSVADPTYMPEHWKKSIISLGSRFPTHTILWKYNDDDVKNEKKFGKLPENLVLSKWLPQTDLLSDIRLKAFVTHGGYNSLLESAYSGTALVVVPLMGDQHRNGMVAFRHGFGVNVQKSDFSGATLERQIKIVLNDKSYTQNAQQLARQLRKRPIRSEELVVKWTEFLAEFQTLPNLDAAARTMSFIEVYNVDCLIVLSAGLFILFWTLYKLVCSCCCRQKLKTKKD